MKHKLTILAISLFAMLTFTFCTDKDAMLEIADDPAPTLRSTLTNKLVPIYRFYCWDNTKKGDHLYLKTPPPGTKIETHTTMLKHSNNYTYRYEGIPFSIYTNKDAIADIPLYLFYDANNVNHYFGNTSIMNGISGQLLGYISSKKQLGLEPLYEYYLDKDKDSFYFLDEFWEPRTSIESMGYVYKKIIGYVSPTYTYLKNKLAPIKIEVNDNKINPYITRIGEYYWTTTNLLGLPDSYEYIPMANQTQINNSLWAVAANAKEYNIHPVLFNYYAGTYYTREGRKYIHKYAKVYEYKNSNYVQTSGWGMPRPQDVRQLYAMCGTGLEYEVREALCFKENQSPVAIKATNVFFMSGNNNNQYGFNLIYSGYRYHGNNPGKYNSIKDRPLTLYKGDLAGMGNAHYIPTMLNSDTPGLTAMIEDYPSTQKEPDSWLLLPIRFCRRLTNQELGYRLYINAAQTDIKKLNLTQAPPAGYKELENSYLRGFYVQYIINGKNPNLTVAQLKALALRLPDVTHNVAPIDK